MSLHQLKTHLLKSSVCREDNSHHEYLLSNNVITAHILQLTGLLNAVYLLDAYKGTHSKTLQDFDSRTDLHSLSR